MNDNLMFDYLLQMGAMRPEEEQLKRKQQMIDALRGTAAQVPQGQMIGKRYVAPTALQNVAQIAQSYMAGKAQEGQDAAMSGLNQRQREILANLRRRGSQFDPATDYTQPYYDGTSVNY